VRQSHTFAQADRAALGCRWAWSTGTRAPATIFRRRST
jgi:hypothetical protein